MKKMCYFNAVPVHFFPSRNDALASHIYWITSMPDRILYWMRAQPVGAFLHSRRRFDCRDADANSSVTTTPASKHLGLATALVPGGKYLITDDGKRMSVWELGVGSQSDFRWVSTINHEHPRRARVTKPTLEVYRAPNGIDFRVVVFFDHSRYVLNTISKPRSATEPSTETKSVDFTSTTFIPNLQAASMPSSY